MSTPNEPPPSYEQSTAAKKTGFLDVPQTRNGISPAHRRSMEDERRELPEGWVRSYDPESSHQFFVNTKVDPPKSIWHHPYDDEEYLNTLSPAERDRITRLNRSVSLKDITAESSDDEAGPSSKVPIRGGAGSSVASSSAPSSSEPAPTGLHKYGRKLKDRVTNSTHEERERERNLRAQEEEQAYQQHLAFRNAFNNAIRTGEPQFLAKDRDGHDVYLEPPGGPALPRGSRGYNPYSNGVYSNPNARFVRPQNDYARPYGYGYGGGYGLPLAGGLLGGALLGGLLF